MDQIKISTKNIKDPFIILRLSFSILKTCFKPKLCATKYFYNILLLNPLDTTKSHMDPVPEIVQKQSKHDGLRYGCDQCDYNATKMEALKVTNSPNTKA